MKVAWVRGFGYHVLGIAVNERYAEYRTKYIASDIKLEDWRWLSPKKVDLIILHPKPYFLVDPLHLVRGAYGITSWIRLDGLEKHLKDVDIIDSPEVYTFLTLQSIKLSKKLKKPIVIQVSETIKNHPITWLPPYSLILKKAVKEANLFIAHTKLAEEWLLSIGVREDKIKMIYPGFDLKLFHPPNKPRRKDITRILFAGNLVESKGIPELLKAFSRLYDAHGKKIELWVCGNGPLKALVKKYSRIYPIKHLGRVPWRNMPEIYRKCDVFCLPSKDLYKMGVKIWEEHLGFVLVEAMASGLPVVTTKCGAIPEVVGQKNFVVRQGSVSQLHEALNILLEDEGLRRKVGTSNRKRCCKLFDGKKQCKMYEESVLSLV